ncbi:ABC transporter ATP-binding protein [Colwellia sp. RSH04]|uniref:ABC transporter ATP-binding protein n=1 Tax=Colwellia sp. RSH04 TaxID=2305464 RepID=UPI000E5849B4|nr:ABC transporter ATP-binding protein [Colwellia sp. RSH04]RHW75202.1 ABC transporter ATP-binding protein [Colwellia sp. RSH04]
MSAVISIENLNKSFDNQPVLSRLNWTINQGDIVGLLGKNGAGKSTLLKSLLNIDDIDSGKISIFNEAHMSLSIASKERIGYVPQENDEISWLSVTDLIKFRKQFYQQWSDEKVCYYLDKWQIDPRKKMVELSPGQAQKVLITLALASRPELLVFDEPASALDPAGRRDLLKELVNLACDENITVIFSTHITSDLERLASKIAILDKGTICYFDDLDKTKENVVRLTLHGKQLTQQHIPNALRVEVKGDNTYCVVKKIDERWLQELQQQGIKIDVSPMGLEDIFLEITAS